MTVLHRLRMASAAVLALAAVGALPSCNAVLGIEERELVVDETQELSCELYCETTAANCAGDFQQYESPATCMAMCEQLELGTLEDKSGDTVGCRLHNAELAASTGELADHCPLAGPASGGACGDRCESFCAVFTASCAGLSAVATDLETCRAFCSSSRDNPSWTPLDDQLRDHDDSIQCRLWHLANATLAPDVHCAHADGTVKCELPGDGAGGGAGSGT
jgi:hypothetical protein